MAIRRRGNGEGSIFYDKKRKRWVGKYQIIIDGIKKRQSVYVKGEKKQNYKDECLKKLREEQAKAAEGKPVIRNGSRVGEYLDEWLEGKIKRGDLRPFTIDSYKLTVRRYIKPAIGHKVLSSLTKLDVQRLIDSYSGANKSPHIPYNIKKVLSSALNFAIDMGILNQNAAYRVKIPKIHETERNIWTPEQINQFLDEVKRFDSVYLPVFMALFSTGMRRGECIGLRWCDVNIEKRTFHINQQITLKGISEPKTKASKRTISFPEYLVPVLTSQKSYQPGSDNFVFTTVKGTPIYPSNISRSFRIIVKRLGLPKATPHGIRVMFASYAMNYGAPRVVQEMLGHSNSKITQEIYQRGNIDDKMNVSAKVANSMGFSLNFAP